MNRLRGPMFVFLVMGFVVIAPFVRAQQTKQAEHEAMYYRYLEFPSYVKGGSVDPHWMADGSSFWYAEGAPANTVIYKVDPRANTKTPLFDTARLRKALTPVMGHEPPYKGVPFEEFTFLDGEKAVKFFIDKNEYVLQLDTYSITRAPVLSEEEKSRQAPRAREVLSPDGRWFAGVSDYNIYLHSIDDGRILPLTTDGIKGYNWDYGDYFEVEAKWSPDSHKLAVMKMDSRKVVDVPIVHWLKPKVDVEWISKRWGGPWETNEIFVVDIFTKRELRINTGEDPDQQLLILGWHPDGSELYFLRTDRGFKKLELMAADPATGATRTILTETQKTFVGGWRFGGSYRYRGFTLLRDGKGFLWMSERDGWNHLYLYNTDGSLIRRLTEGEFPVGELVAVDEKSGWVYFIARGNQQRPYDTHLYRVNLEGKNFTRLTEASGQHAIDLAPSKEFYLDTHSTVARPPAGELRRADGTLLKILSKTNIDALKEELNWSPPEEFVVKAADNRTDIYGVLYKPYDFDPNKKYPVIDFIYADACCAVVPQRFEANFGGSWGGWNALLMAQLGFVTFVVDGRGTPNRGKAFQDVVYGNWGVYEIPDHVADLKQLAEKRSYMDLNRVGITGYSTGGHFALRAMLLAPDIYQVGVSGAGDGDTGSDIGYGPVSANLPLVGNLKGKLLLIHGTNDHNVNFDTTMRVADALIRAGKYFDLIVVPEGDHRWVAMSPYVGEAICRYFVEHLKP